MSPIAQPTTLLVSKLAPPPVRAHWIDRPGLLAPDDGLTSAQTTLLAAPPGYGKTTLLSQWVHRSHDGAPIGTGQPVFHWLTLDAADNTLPRFLAYLQAAGMRSCSGHAPIFAHAFRSSCLAMRLHLMPAPICWRSSSTNWPARPVPGADPGRLPCHRTR
ncbi:MAG: hypothetical protein R2854_15050 [Caldilineaceae bacterium]